MEKYIHHDWLLTGVFLDKNKSQLLSEINEGFSIEINETGVEAHIC